MSNLARFVEAQKGVYPAALAELRGGQKRSHWMWFIFPQIAGLGRSETARFYAIADRREARAYLDHQILAPRLRECCEAVLAWVGDRSTSAILGPVDAMKLQSSMTLFAETADDPAPFIAVLDAYYGGERDPQTLQLLT